MAESESEKPPRAPSTKNETANSSSSTQKKASSSLSNGVVRPPAKRPSTTTATGVTLDMRANPDGSSGPGGNAANTTADTTADQFARSVALMSVAHIARGVGFDGIQRSAGDALVEILAKYITRIGCSAKEIAEHAGRTQPRATDVMTALSDLLPVPVDLMDLIKALETAKRPFPRDVPAFPVRKRDLASAAAVEQSKIGNREDLPAYVPSFLPPLPNRHTYSSDSRVVVERERDQKRTRLDLLAQKSHVQQSLHGLQTALGKTSTPLVTQQSWNALQGAASDQASGNPYVQPAAVRQQSSSSSSSSSIFGRMDGPSIHKKSVFGGPDRSFAPTMSRDKQQRKNPLDANAPLTKLTSSQELGKEEKILTGTFHDGDSE